MRVPGATIGFQIYCLGEDQAASKFQAMVGTEPVNESFVYNGLFEFSLAVEESCLCRRDTQEFTTPIEDIYWVLFVFYNDMDTCICTNIIT